LILAMTVFETHTAQESGSQWWACSLLMSPPLSAEAGCESRERIGLLLVFIA